MTATNATIASILSAAQAAGYAALAADQTSVKALSGDRIVMLTAEGETSDVLEVLLVKKKVLTTRSLVSEDKVSVGVMVFDADGVALEDGSKAVLYKSPTLPKPAKKGSKKVEGAPTKLSLCRQIFNDNLGADKAEVKKMFQEQANCTRMGANTYFLLISKEVAAAEATEQAAGTDAQSGGVDEEAEARAELAEAQS